MARGALWLLQEVGVGNVFTKEDIRRAFPGIAQADRRIRDLRKFSWRLETSATDASLAPEEQRFAEAGVAVWDPKARAVADSGALRSLSPKQRAAAMAADGYQCVLCGIAGGEMYVEPPKQLAVLTVSRVLTNAAEEPREELLTLCTRCADGNEHLVGDTMLVDRALDDLSPGELDVLRRWLSRGRRARTPLDRAWLSIQRLPAAIRADVAARVQDRP